MTNDKIIGIWVLGDRLWMGQSALQSCVDKKHHSVIFIESLRHAQELPYHLQKLVLVWSAMRHFAEELKQAGWNVTYKQAEDFQTPLIEWIQQNQIAELRVMTPSDRPFTKLIEGLNLPCQVTFTPNNRFIWSDEEFIQWASSRKRLIMENFYREGRKRFDILIGNTHMNCLYQILKQVKEIGYAHHIQRLMILNNFALIAGFSPQELEDWFHAAFIDAYDWVMQTNVIGMRQFADGGMMASKPYATSANYVNKMSDYYKNCDYNPRDRTGEKACPFNFFY